MASDPSSRFPRSCRLLHSADFGRLKFKGERIASGSILVNWIEGHKGPVSRIGIITTKKLGNAVVRNRARRLIREAFRHLRLHFTTHVEMVVVARPSIVRKDAAGVTRDLRRFAETTGLMPKRPE